MTFQITTRRTDFMEDGTCTQVGPAMFFPKKGERGDMTAAKKICGACLVRDECLGYALDNNIRHGIWGGKSRRQREIIRAQREMAVSPASFA